MDQLRCGDAYGQAAAQVYNADQGCKAQIELQSEREAAWLKGLHIMTDDLSSTSVMFTTDRSHALINRMSNLADSFFALLRDCGLVSQQSLMSQRLLSSDSAQAGVKVHGTLMNTKYSRGGRREDGARSGDRETFDASALMERLGQVDFGEVMLREIQLSSLDEMNDDGYYRSNCNIPLASQFT